MKVVDLIKSVPVTTYRNGYLAPHVLGSEVSQADHSLVYRQVKEIMDTDTVSLRCPCDMLGKIKKCENVSIHRKVQHVQKKRNKIQTWYKSPEKEESVTSRESQVWHC